MACPSLPAGLARFPAREAVVQSFENGFRWTALAMSLGLVLILLLKRPESAVAVEGAH